MHLLKRLLLLTGAALLIVAAASASAQNFTRRNVRITSQGLKMGGWLYVPKGLKEGEKRPTIVMAHGWSAVKEMYLDDYAAKFSNGGFVVVVFDYRNFGDSEGEAAQPHRPAYAARGLQERHHLGNATADGRRQPHRHLGLVLQRRTRAASRGLRSPRQVRRFAGAAHHAMDNFRRLVRADFFPVRKPGSLATARRRTPPARSTTSPW